MKTQERPDFSLERDLSQEFPAVEVRVEFSPSLAFIGTLVTVGKCVVVKKYPHSRAYLVAIAPED